MDENRKITSDEAEKILREKENAGGLEFDLVKEDSTESVTSLGKATNLTADPNMEIPGSNLGWKPLPIDNLPSGGLFYPDGTTMEIRACNVQEIRHFSTIDENDPLDMDDKLNIIIDKCLKIKFPDRHANWKDLKEEDRFYLLFAIRDLTFLKGENKLYLTLKCGRLCIGDGSYMEKVEIKKENFDYYRIDERLMKFYDSNERCFIIESPKVGIIRLYVPSLGVTTFIKNYLRQKVQNNEFYDKAFLKVAAFMFPDWRGLDEKTYNNKVQESIGWSPMKLSSTLKLAEMIRYGVKTDVNKICSKCGAEVTTPLNFPGGVKSLFLPSDPLAELFGE